MKIEPLALTKMEIIGNLKSHYRGKMRTRTSWDRLNRVGYSKFHLLKGETVKSKEKNQLEETKIIWRMFCFA